MKHTAHILGFAARINGVDHPAAIFKFSGKDAYCWTWHEPSKGHVIVFDSFPINKSVRLSEGQVFQSMTEQHASLHFDGRRHRTIKASGRNTAHVSKHQSVAIPDIKSWLSLRSVEIPLIEPFWEMSAGAWRDVQHPKILRSEDFDGAGGVCLHAFICSCDRIDDLIRTWRVATRHWVEGNQRLRLVVLAEPLRI